MMHSIQAILVCGALAATGCNRENDTKMPDSANVTKDDDFDAWWAEYTEVSDALDPYHDRIIAQHGTGKPANEVEETLFICMSYWLTAIVNSGDIFGHLDYIIGHEHMFRAIGATETLATKEKLLPLYEEMQAKSTDEERNEFWHATKEEREDTEDLEEGAIEFAKLLLAYAQAHDAKIYPKTDNGEQGGAH